MKETAHVHTQTHPFVTTASLLTASYYCGIFASPHECLTVTGSWHKNWASKKQVNSPGHEKHNREFLLLS